MYNVIITSAGSGSRMGLGYNKMLYNIAGKTMIEHAVELFTGDDRCSQIIVTTAIKDLDQMRLLFKDNTKIELATGGKTRQDSVYNGLQLVTEDIVLVHDGSRPFATQQMVDACYNTAKEGSGAIVAVKPKDTIKKMRADHHVEETLDRDELIAVQTPQAFQTDVLKMAYELADEANFIGTDDASLVEKFTDVEVKVVPGAYTNMKFTTEEDIDIFEYFLTKE